MEPVHGVHSFSVRLTSFRRYVHVRDYSYSARPNRTVGPYCRRNKRPMTDGPVAHGGLSVIIISFTITQTVNSVLVPFE